MRAQPAIVCERSNAIRHCSNCEFFFFGSFFLFASRQKEKMNKEKLKSFKYIPIILIMDLKNINLNVKMILI